MFLPGAGCGERLVTVRRRDPEFGPGPSAGPDRRTATVRSFFDVGDAELSATDRGWRHRSSGGSHCRSER